VLAAAANRPPSPAHQSVEAGECRLVSLGGSHRVSMYHLTILFLSNLKRGRHPTLPTTQQTPQKSLDTHRARLGAQFALSSPRKATGDGEAVMNVSGASNGWDPNSLIEADFILPSQLGEASVAARTGEFGLLWPCSRTAFRPTVEKYCG